MSKLKKYYYKARLILLNMRKNLVLLFIILLLSAFLRYQFVNEPLERDEGGYAYIGKQLLEGKVLYKEMWDQKTAGIFFIYAFAIKFFGDSLNSIRIFTLIFVLIEIFLFFLLVKKLYGENIALVATFIFGIFSSVPLMQANGANSEVFMNLFFILSVYLFLFNKKKFLIYSGIALAIGFMIKQVAIVNLLAILLFIILFDKKNKKEKVLSLIIGFFIGLVPFLIYFIINNNLYDFIFAAFSYNLGYVNTINIVEFFSRMVNNSIPIILEGALFWCLALIGLFFILIKRDKKNMLVLFLLLFSILGVLIGKRFFPHYYIQLIPICSILGGYAVIKGLKLKYFKWILILMVVSLSFFFISSEYKYYFVYDNNDVSFIKYKTDIFVKAKDVADYINQNTVEEDFIYNIGYEPELYFYSKRESASRFIYSFHLMKSYVGDNEFLQEGRKELLEDIKLKKPKYLIVSDIIDDFNELDKIIEERYLIDKLFPYSDGSFLIYKIK